MLGVFLSLAHTCWCVSFTASSLESVQSATDLIVQGLLDYYPLASNDSSKSLGAVPGMFQQPYYWWEAGVAWGMLVDWQFLTNQTEHVDMIKQALTFQAGDSGDYMPSNQSLTEGNDDQGFWALAAMTAAERNFSNPGSGYHSYAYSAQAVFNEMKSRWETQKCGGGLRWQIYTWNSGYNYKNTVSNGCFMNLAARLAVYTGNSSYADWAEKIYQWFVDVQFLNTTNGNSWPVYDGASMDTNCTNPTTLQWTYNSGLLLSSIAFMHEYTNGSGPWAGRAKSIWTQAKTQFFQDDIAYESACQPSHCNTDQRCFKGIFLQHLGLAAIYLDDLRSDIMTAINATASAAAISCSGGTDNHTCGLNWLTKSAGTLFGLGEQISALSALINTQVLGRPKPFSIRTGASSNGSVTAGQGDQETTTQELLDDSTPPSTGDKAGAGILTAVLLIFLIAVGVWIVL